MNNRLFLLIPLFCAFTSLSLAKKAHMPEPDVNVKEKIAYVDFTKYFEEKPNAEISMIIDGKAGHFAEISPKTPIYFKQSISFNAEGSNVKDIKSSGAQISLEKRNGVWGFRVKTTK
jgi:hypothetical protein